MQHQQREPPPAGIRKAVVHHRRPDPLAPELPLYADDAHKAGGHLSPCQADFSFVNEVHTGTPALHKRRPYPVSGLARSTLDKRPPGSGRDWLIGVGHEDFCHQGVGSLFLVAGDGPDLDIARWRAQSWSPWKAILWMNVFCVAPKRIAPVSAPRANRPCNPAS